MIEDIESRVLKLVASQLDLAVEEIKLDSNFTEVLGADSLDLVELVMAIEDEFDVAIPDEGTEKLNTPKDIIDFLLKH